MASALKRLDYDTNEQRQMAKKLVIDLDGTLTHIDSNVSYEDVAPRVDVIERLREFKDSGFEIVIYTARNMRTYSNSIGKINVNTLPCIIDWLEKNRVPYDEIHVAKPWCGEGGFYVDDKAIRPSEFLSLSESDVQDLLDKEKV